jgi:homoserine dehydrogenase
MKPINVGLLGIGTVGGGTWTVLARNREEIQRRAGREIRIAMVADKDLAKAQRLVGGQAKCVADGSEVATSPDIDIVIELIGGYTIAKELALKAIANGKHVVTANKAMLAVHGNEIFAAAQKKGVMVGFEAAVAGGVPIIKAVREGLAANRIEWIAGIINGTSNFILSEMREKGLAFDDVLREAQRLGYAEPTRPSTSRASTPRTSSRSSPRSRRHRCSSTVLPRGHRPLRSPMSAPRRATQLARDCKDTPAGIELRCTAGPARRRSPT